MKLKYVFCLDIPYLKGVLKSLRIYLGDRCLVGVRYKFLNLREYISMEVKVKFGLLRANNLCEILPAHLITILKFSIFVCFLLNSVVRKMNELVGNIIQWELSTTSADVTVLVAITFQATIYASK